MRLRLDRNGRDNIENFRVSIPIVDRPSNLSEMWWSVSIKNDNSLALRASQNNKHVSDSVWRGCSWLSSPPPLPAPSVAPSWNSLLPYDKPTCSLLARASRKRTTSSDWSFTHTQEKNNNKKSHRISLTWRSLDQIYRWASHCTFYFAMFFSFVMWLLCPDKKFSLTL